MSLYICKTENIYKICHLDLAVLQPSKVTPSSRLSNSSSSSVQTFGKTSQERNSTGKSLEEQPESLEEHTESLEEHTESLEAHTESLEEQTESLEAHTDCRGGYL